VHRVVIQSFGVTPAKGLRTGGDGSIQKLGIDIPPFLKR
jgi:hypothetical protein